MTALCLGVDCGTKALGLALVEMEPYRAVWAERVSIDERDQGWRYQQVGNALRHADGLWLPHSPIQPFRSRLLGAHGLEVERVAIEVPPFVNNKEVYAQLREVFALVGAEAHRRWPWAPQISANVSTWKQAVLGNGKATKAQVMEWADDALTRDATPVPDLAQDAADALAVATYGAGVELVEEAA